MALEDGAEVRAKVILSNATPKITFLDLLPKVYKTIKFTQIAWIAWERDQTGYSLGERPIAWERDQTGYSLGERPIAWERDQTG